MTVAAPIRKHYAELTESQQAVVGHVDGPLLAIAGPGSGKTHSIVLRALNLLLLEKAAPKEIVLCTFTEKAAFEMRDRLAAAARKTGYQGDLSELTIATIHGFCNRLLTEHRHRTSLGHGYETLDDLTQLLFIFEHFDAIVGETQNGKYLQRWTTRWTVIEGARGYFNKITEELVDPALLAASDDAFLAAIGTACQRYEAALRENNRVDFAHLQRLAYDLLRDADSAEAVAPSVRFMLVDEYQDTNYIQEQLLVKLAGDAGNLCVVGDEDQSLYRFRGATVRNILEKEDYILVGKVDLLLGGDGKLELLDFKTSPRPTDSPALLDAYERQLCTYAHILEQRRGRRVDRLLLYWTAEERKQDALMVLPYRPDRVDAAGRHFDATVQRIQAGEFGVEVPPEPRICRECDLRTLCRAEGVIEATD